MTVTTAIEAIAGAVVAFLTFIGGRFTARSARRASRETRSEKWERRYRAGAEAHIRWDTLVVSEFTHLQYLVRDLQVQMGKEPGEIKKLPDPPPLFPDDEEEVHD